jgi:hypothetical protein
MQNSRKLLMLKENGANNANFKLTHLLKTEIWDTTKIEGGNLGYTSSFQREY